MSDCEWLIELCQRQQNLVNSDGCIFNEEDAEDIRSWSVENCGMLRSKVMKRTRHMPRAYAWVWCIQCGPCAHCSYGLRHGICSRSDSDYGKLSRRLIRGLNAVNAWVLESGREGGN